MNRGRVDCREHKNNTFIGIHIFYYIIIIMINDQDNHYEIETSSLMFPALVQEL